MKVHMQGTGGGGSLPLQKQLPCLSISKVEVFLLQKKKKNQP